MGKNVLVKCVSKHSDGCSDLLFLRDITIGNTYKAYKPDALEIDSEGLPVSRDDEIWIEADDAGDEVVCFIGSVFEIVG